MDTGRLKRFATEARNILMQGVAHRFTSLGFSLDGTTMEEPQRFEGGATFMGETVSLDFYDKWQSLAQAIQHHGIKAVIEEAAYTWFNRLMAIRIMVKNHLIPPVLQYESEGVFVPLFVTEARQGRFPQMPEDDRRKLMALLDDDSKTEEQFRILIVAFCHANPVINACFGHIKDYTELLLPTNILAEGGFVDLINHTEFITEEDYKSPELIGWLYQFYISEKKDEVFAKKGKFESDEIPAATQIFTPNWIVKYMVQNTIGRIYLDNNPYETEIQHKWKYLVEPTEKTPDDKILHYDDLTELKFGDLACGSGHILNEGFDMLYDLYIFEGYSRKDAIESIFRYNLTGIDIDTRAKQLAQFALLLKACQKDASFADAHLMPRVLDMPEPYPYKDDLRDTLPHFFIGGNQEMILEVCNAIDLMDQAKNLGSIMKFNISERTRNAIAIRMKEYEQHISYSDEFEQLKDRMRIILALTEEYSALVMNPPYMGGGNMNAELSDYVKCNYDAGKADLCTTFMEMQGERTAKGGYYANIIPPSWMFLSTFEKLRNKILYDNNIKEIVQLSNGVFGGDFGSTISVINNCKHIRTTASFFRVVEKTFQLIDQDDLRKILERAIKNHSFKFDFRSYQKGEVHHSDLGKKIFYSKDQNVFIKIPSTPFAYWINEHIIDAYLGKTIKHFFTGKEGVGTRDDKRFMRLFWEVSLNKTGKGNKWVLSDKAGGARKWYGSIINVMNWENDGFEIRNFKDEKGKLISRPQNIEWLYKEGISWGKVTASKHTFRWRFNGYAFNDAAPTLFPQHIKSSLAAVIAMLNTKVGEYLLDISGNTINATVGSIEKMPFLTDGFSGDHFVQENINIEKSDWDAHETSWDFETNPLISLSGKTDIEEEGEIVGLGPAPDSIDMLYQEYKAIWERYFNQLHQNEEELNRQFIEIYGLQDELTPDVPLDEITILQQGEISIKDDEIVWHPDVVMKQLISYAIGCMMGRYSIDKPGLILANQGDGIEQYKKQVPDSRFEVDEDGIIPLMSAQSDFADNATVRFKQWLSVAFGEETLVENLNFIEKCLGKSVDDYFVKDFWKDHKKMYQNRPIYWLFSSSKGAFQCLAYMHRMDAYTAERVRTKYLLPHIEWLIQQQGELEANAANLSGIERKRLDSITKQIQECREYHDRLHVIADQQIAFDLDDGVVVNYAKFGDVLAKIK